MFLAIHTIRYAEAAESGKDAPAQTVQVSEDTRISYLGPEGTYTEEAAQYFFETGIFQPKETVPEAIADVRNGARKKQIGSRTGIYGRSLQIVLQSAGKGL